MITANLTQFLNIFPQFNNPDMPSQYYFDDTYVWAVDNWNINVFGSRINMAIYLMTAHRLTLMFNAQTNQSGQGGKVASATVGQVSVSYEAMPKADKFDYWLSLSPYGLELLGMLQTLTASPKYYGGSLTRVF